MLAGMAERFTGKMRLAEGDVIPVELVFREAELTLVAEGATVGSWPIKFCRVSRLGPSEFQVVIDGEPTSFVPDDAQRFGVAAAQRFQASSLADRINVVRHLSTVEQEPPQVEVEEVPPGRGRHRGRAFPVRPGTAAALLAGAVVAVTALVLVGREAAPPATTLPPATTTSSTRSAQATIFDVIPAAFVEDWNRLADEFDVPLLIRGAPASQGFESRFTDHLALQVTTDLDGTLSSVVVTADPAGDSQSDALVVQAWGLAIAVGSPELDAGERREVLRRLGIDVDRPDLGGLDGEAAVGRTRYSLQYLPGFSTVLFTMASSESSGPGR
jgi:hypothetical protein